MNDLPVWAALDASVTHTPIPESQPFFDDHVGPRRWRLYRSEEPTPSKKKGVLIRLDDEACTLLSDLRPRQGLFEIPELAGNPQTWVVGEDPLVWLALVEPALESLELRATTAGSYRRIVYDLDLGRESTPETIWIEGGELRWPLGEGGLRLIVVTREGR